MGMASWHCLLGLPVKRLILEIVQEYQLGAIQIVCVVNSRID